MKTLSLLAAALFAFNAQAAGPNDLFPGSAGKPVTLSVTEATLNVTITPKNLKWSKADYTMPVVKVLVPELADVTILDHRNTGEGAPCLASYEAQSPEQVIQDRPDVEQVPFKITLEKHLNQDPRNGKCSVILAEKVEGVIRGFKFEHYRMHTIGERHISDCR